MRLITKLRLDCRSLILSLPVILATGAFAADTNSIRLAVGPFYAPADNAVLARAAEDLPDILMVSLSAESRFQLVERNKVNTLWSELNLTRDGLTSAANIVKLGHILSCDWLVSGALVPAGSGAQIWVKVINTQDSVVMDLQSVPFNPTNLAATAASIASFLARTEPRAQPREFIALGKFNDWTVSANREDWSPRLVALIETNFLAAGYGVVERDTVAPIFSEYEFQAAGLSEKSTNRVKLKPAFWIVDGGCKWIHNTQDEVSVSISVQKMGGGEQLLNFTKPAGPELEKAVLAAVQSALANTGAMTPAQAQAGEEQARAAHLEELIRGRGTPPVLHIPTNQTFITVTGLNGVAREMTVDPAYVAIRKSHADELLKTLQQAILLNPNDMRSKFYLGMALFHRPDPHASRQAMDLLQEVAGSNDPVFASKAQTWLADLKAGRISFQRDAFGMMNIVTHGQAASFPAVDTNALAQATAALAAKFQAEYGAKNIATRTDPIAKIPTIPRSADFRDVTDIKLWRGGLLVACGKALKSFDLNSGTAKDIRVSLKPAQSIAAIEADNDSLWLGTGAGLLQVSLADGTTREFGEKDGFPAPAITALRLDGRGRLYIGFNGAFGCLDIRTGKFTGMMAPINLRETWDQAMREPPTANIRGILTADGTHFWTSSQLGLQFFDSGSNQWSAAAPQKYIHEIGMVGANSLSANSKYFVAQDFMHSVALRPLPGTNWLTLNINTNENEKYPDGIALDPANPAWLWTGFSADQVTLVDLATFKIVAEGKLTSAGSGFNTVNWIIPTADKVAFITHDPADGSYILYCLDKSSVFAAPSVAAQPAAGPDTDFRAQFLQKNFSKFTPVNFQKGDNGEVVLHRIRVQDTMFTSGTKCYCGFKFTMPPWLDGDLGLLNTLAKTESQKDYTTKQLDPIIIAENGETSIFDGYTINYLADCPALARQLPYTQKAITRYFDRQHLVAGKNYAICFEFEDPNLPDVAYAVTIASERGEKEFGRFPNFDPLHTPTNGRPPPASAEELRRAIETALKQSDRTALISLFNWQEVADDDKADLINGNVANLLNQDALSVTLQPLPGMVDWTNEEVGFRIRPNLPLLGVVNVKTDAEGWEIRLPYGQIGNSYYLSCKIREPK